MYDFKLNKDENVIVISDNNVIYTDNDIKELSCIITNQRLLFLDEPSKIHNSMEDLRISGKMNYIRKKEVIEEIYLNEIDSLTKKDDFYILNLRDGRFININGDVISHIEELIRGNNND